MNLNQVNLIGRVTKKPELKALPSGIKTCSFSLATNRNWKDKEGAKKEDVEFHNLVSFAKTAETIAQWVEQGQLLFVTGRLQTRMWEDKEGGKKNYRTEIVIEQFQFGPKAGTAGSTAHSQEDDQTPPEDINPEDIPF